MLPSKHIFKILISLLYGLTFIVFIMLYRSTFHIGWAYSILIACLALFVLLKKYGDDMEIDLK